MTRYTFAIFFFFPGALNPASESDLDSEVPSEAQVPLKASYQNIVLTGLFSNQPRGAWMLPEASNSVTCRPC